MRRMDEKLRRAPPVPPRRGYLVGLSGRDRAGCGRAVLRALRGIGRDVGPATVDAQALDAARIGVEDLEFELVRPGDELAARGDAAGERNDEAAQRVDVVRHVVGGEVDAQGLRNLLDARPRVGDEGVALPVQDQAGRPFVVLVLDVADDGFDQVLDRDEAVRASVLVDDERHVSARGLHPHQKIEGGHGARDVDDRAEDLGRGDCRREVDIAEAGRLGRVLGSPPLRAGLCPRGDMVEEITDVDHALGVVQRLAEDGKPRMRGRAEDAPKLAEAGLGRDGDDVGARHHDIVHADAVKAEHVLEHRPFLGREVRVVCRFGEGILEIVADRIA